MQDALSAVDAAKQFYKIIRSANNFNRFYNKSVATAEEHNIDLPELPRYLRLHIKNVSEPNVFTSAKKYFTANLLKACDLLHYELENRFDEHIPSVPLIKKKTIKKPPDKCSKWP